jgi:hypothetical protein
MNRAHDLSFVWALADWAAECMHPDARARLCAKIGAGEYDSAITDLLVFYSNRQVELPYELAAPIRAWIRGYAGTGREAVLLRLHDRLRVSLMTQPTSRESAVKGRRLVARRYDRSNCTASNRKDTVKARDRSERQP